MRPFALAALGGVLHFLAFVGFGFWPLAFVSLVPLWAALEDERIARARDASLVGFCFGAVAYAGGYTFLLHPVDAFLGGNYALGGALWVVHGAWFALGFALLGVVYLRARRRGWPIAVAGVAPLLVLEWLYPALFPVHVGDALVDRSALIQIADLGGPLLVSTVVALANAAILETWRWLRSQRPASLRTASVAALFALLAWGYGTWRVEQLSRAIAGAPSLRVGLVQANLGVAEKRRDPVLVHERHLEQSRELLAGAELDLLVWPETVYSRGLAGALPISGAGIRSDLRVPLLFGGASVRTVGGMRRTYNSALLIGADGAIRTAYDKNLLVPFTETVPFAAASERFAAIFPHAQHFGAGSDTPPLVLGEFRIATPICSESVEPWFVRNMVARANPHLLVSLANDAWFGDSQEPWIHLALARFRSIEHRRALVHATNSGVSAIVDPLGRVVARAGLQTRENLVATVPLLDGQTLYGRFGDWPGWIGAGVTAMAMLTRKRPHEPRRSASPRYASS